MLGAEVGQDRVGQVAFEEVGGPALPFGQQALNGSQVIVPEIPTQQLDGARRRSCSCIQKRNVNLTPRKRPAEIWKVADDQRQEAKPVPASRMATSRPVESRG